MVMPQAGQAAQRRRQSLPNGSGIALRPVAPLVQAGAGGVQHNGHLVFQYGELNLVHRAGLVKPVNVVVLFQALYHSFFDDFLAVRHTVQGGRNRVPFHRKCVCTADKLAPWQSPYRLEQLLKSHRRKAIQYNQDPLRKAAVDIGTGQHGLVAIKEHPAVFGCHIPGVHLS